MMNNILIINQYAANKGDRAVLFALVTELLNHTKNITVSTSEPELWKGYKFYEENGIHFVPWGWDYDTRAYGLRVLLRRFKKYTYTINRELFLRAEPFFRWLAPMLTNPLFIEALRKSDLVISTGGHHVTTILARDAVSEQVFDLSLAHWEKKRLILWSQTIGPLDFYNDRNRRFVTKILNNTERAFIRDMTSMTLVEGIVSKEKVKKTFESVFILNHKFKKYTVPSKRANIIGVSIYSTKNRDKVETESYIASITAVVNYAISQGIEVQFFPMEVKGSAPDDRKMISMIMERISNKSRCYVHDNDMDTLTHMKKVSLCRAFIGHKTHSVIFGLTVGTPMVALAYHVKTVDFMEQFGLRDNCIQDNDITSERIISILDSVLAQADKVGMQQYRKSSELADKIRKDIASIFV